MWYLAAYVTFLLAVQTIRGIGELGKEGQPVFAGFLFCLMHCPTLVFPVMYLLGGK